MKVDIWSDIRCPFCYIGKKKFEKALEKFPHRDKVEVEWHSFQLDPGLKTQPDLDSVDYLAQVKGMPRDQVVQMHEHVNAAAKEVGLVFDFDRSIVANSFNAHRLIQLAKSQGLGDHAKEHLFRAHFTEGRNIDDANELRKIGVAVGLDPKAVDDMLASNAYAEKVQEDETVARHIGIRGVPFFVLNNKHALSGAQPPEVFLEALTKVWAEGAAEGQSVEK